MEMRGSGSRGSNLQRSSMEKEKLNHGEKRSREGGIGERKSAIGERKRCKLQRLSGTSMLPAS